VQDEILTDLAKIADLKVISRTARDAGIRHGIARNMRRIGLRSWASRHVVEGKVQRAATRFG
jgi:TolB-like protein